MIQYLLLMAGLMLAPSAAHAASACKPGPQPVFNITTSVAEPRFDYKLSQKAMENFKGNAELPAGAIYDLTVNAMSTGRIQIKNSLKYITQTMSDKQVCIQVSQANIDIHIDPVIYIATELRNDACEYKEYLLHELKHVEEDKRLIDDYKAIIERNMAFAFPNVADYGVGPVPASLSKDARKKLEENVIGTLDATIGSMLRERVARQRAIDSTGEYMRLSLACGQSTVGIKPELRKP